MVITALVGRRNAGIRNVLSANAVDGEARSSNAIITRNAIHILTQAVADESRQLMTFTVAGQLVVEEVVSGMRMIVSSRRKNAMGHQHDDLAVAAEGDSERGDTTKKMLRLIASMAVQPEVVGTDDMKTIADLVEVGKHRLVLGS